MERTDPDAALMLAVKAGRPGAFAALVERYGTVLVNFFYRQTGRRDLAEDLAQETFLRIYRARDRYRPTARFRTWLFTVATNLVLNRRRYDSYRNHVSLEATAEGERTGRLADDRAPDPARGAEVEELRGRVRAAVGTLPPNQRLAINLYRFQGLSYREVAETMGLSVAAVKSLLNRARQNLRQRLAREIRDYLEETPQPLTEPGGGTHDRPGAA